MFGDDAVQSENADELGLKQQSTKRNRTLNRQEKRIEFVGVDEFHIHEMDRVLPSCIKRTTITKCDPSEEHSQATQHLSTFYTSEATYTDVSNQINLCKDKDELQVYETLRYKIVIDWNAVFELSDALKELEPIVLRPMVRRWIHRHYLHVSK